MLQQMSARLRAEPDLKSAMARLLTDVVALHGAEFGDVQLAADGILFLVDQSGFDAPFVTAFKHVEVSSTTACARAFRHRAAVLIRDVGEDPEFQPYRAAAVMAGFRAVQSTPLIGTDGTCIGVVSTHFANPHMPTAIEMQTLDDYARVAADFVRTLAPSGFRAIIRSMNTAVGRPVVGDGPETDRSIP
ncbi:MAG TPA: GAF domain-containing protein [Xanthobacteraceae bacterium]|jgi:GAF domain-containing protein|nr:GAF domain-containing protein [Xanthobacteraceae bacterium]